MEDLRTLRETDGPTSEERNWALGAHLGVFASAVIGPLNFLVPLLIFLHWKDRSDFVADEAREALNFQLTLLILLFAGALLVLVVIGIGVLIVTGLLGIVLPILAAIQVADGRSYRYPLNIRLVQ